MSNQPELIGHYTEPDGTLVRAYGRETGDGTFEWARVVIDASKAGVNPDPRELHYAPGPENHLLLQWIKGERKRFVADS